MQNAVPFADLQLPFAGITILKSMFMALSKLSCSAEDNDTRIKRFTIPEVKPLEFYAPEDISLQSCYIYRTKSACFFLIIFDCSVRSLCDRSALHEAIYLSMQLTETSVNKPQEQTSCLIILIVRYSFIKSDQAVSQDVSCLHEYDTYFFLLMLP
jgi:hypothetical protein